MFFEEDNIYHVFNRGNNQQKIFFKEHNYDYFLNKVKKGIIPYADILAYCLMPNHFHLLMKVKRKASQIKDQEAGHHALVGAIAKLLSSYTQGINKQESRTGSLFQSNTKAICINDVVNNSKDTNAHYYPAICFHYIHQNPVKAALVNKMENWRYSSFNEYLNAASPDNICNINLAKEILELPESKNEFYKNSYGVINETVIEKLKLNI